MPASLAVSGKNKLLFYTSETFLPSIQTASFFGAGSHPGLSHFMEPFFNDWLNISARFGVLLITEG
jgi:hypothetical protein